MNVQHVTPILNVRDLEESFAWFEALGWSKDWDYGDRWTSVAFAVGKSWRHFPSQRWSRSSRRPLTGNTPGR